MQVHPDDAYASTHEQAAGGRGKTEMWYVIAARPGAEVLAGLKPEVTRENFAHAIADGTVENCLERIPVSAGDAIFIPAGTVHTIGPGLVLCEIQQQSDLTYRVYDYDRRDAQGQSRELHIEKALEVMRFGKQTGGRIEPVPARRGGRAVRGGIRKPISSPAPISPSRNGISRRRCPRASSSRTFRSPDFPRRRRHHRVGLANAPHTRRRKCGWFPPRSANTKFLPDARTSLLRAYVPGNLGELARRLEDHGVTGAELCSRMVHS